MFIFVFFTLHFIFWNLKKQSIDVVLGIRTWGRSFGHSYRSTEPWRPSLVSWFFCSQNYFLFWASFLSPKRGRPKVWKAAVVESASVWPDIEIKSSPSFSKSCPKSSLTSLTEKQWFSQMSKKSSNIWATLVIKFVTKNVKNRPFRSHWSASLQ